MKNVLLLPITFLFISCSNNSDHPDVSHIKLDVPFDRFEQTFFTIDTTNIPSGLKIAQQKHPDFYPDFMNEILGVNGSETDTATLLVTREFITGYRPIFDSLSQKYTNVKDIKEDLEEGLRHVKYYFPDYRTGKAITFIGSFDMPGTALTSNGIAIGLHQYAGKDFSVYQSSVGQQLYPTYISRRFEREYIVPNCLKAVVEDLFPDQSKGKGLILQMIEKGKQLWLLDKFSPATHDTLKTGFTGNQLLFCERNEGLIWQKIIVDEKDIYTIEPVSIQTYLGEAPFTTNMGENSPGNIGPWVGWQIVKKYVEKNSSLHPAEIMKTDPRKMFDEARYKPK